MVMNGQIFFSWYWISSYKKCADFAMVIGNPAKIVSWVNETGDKLTFDKNKISECGGFKFHNGIVARI